MTFLPDGRLLVTEMAGTLHLYDPASDTTGNISDVPTVAHVAQGGLGDVVLHPRNTAPISLFTSALSSLTEICSALRSHAPG